MQKFSKKWRSFVNEQKKGVSRITFETLDWIHDALGDHEISLDQAYEGIYLTSGQRRSLGVDMVWIDRATGTLGTGRGEEYRKPDPYKKGEKQLKKAATEFFSTSKAPDRYDNIDDQIWKQLNDIASRFEIDIKLAEKIFDDKLDSRIYSGIKNHNQKLADEYLKDYPKQKQTWDDYGCSRPGDYPARGGCRRELGYVFDKIQMESQAVLFGDDDGDIFINEMAKLALADVSTTLLNKSLGAVVKHDEDYFSSGAPEWAQPWESALPPHVKARLDLQTGQKAGVKTLEKKGLKENVHNNWRKFLKEASMRSTPDASDWIGQKYPVRKTKIHTKPKVGKSKYGYIFGTIDGKILSEENANQLFYGASMNKPMIALANLLIYKNTPKALQPEELKSLLAYQGKYDTNDINRVLSCRTPRKEFKREEKLGCVRHGTAEKFLRKHGLNPYIKIRYGSNKQSPKSYFEFLEFLHNVERIKGIEEEVNIIIDHMKRSPLGLDRSDRESRKWGNYYQKRLRQKGININNLYGKGGRTPVPTKPGQPPAALNYGFIIDNKYILVIYTKLDDKEHMLNLMTTILKDKL